MGGNPSWQSLFWAYNAGPYATLASAPNSPTAEATFYSNRILNELLPRYLP